MEEMSSKVAQLETEFKEAKETIEFLTSERLIMQETMKETEDALDAERKARKEERRAMEELALRAKKLYDKVIQKNEKIDELSSKIRELELQMLECEKGNHKELISAWTELKDALVELDPEEPATNGTASEATLCHELAAFAKIVKRKASSCIELKEDVKRLVLENLQLSSQLKLAEDSLAKLAKSEADLKKLLVEEQARIKCLAENLEQSNENYRCSEAVSKELEKQLKSAANGNGKPLDDCLLLRQELAKFKEALKLKDEKLEGLSGRYERHRKIWEENESRANSEIKKLDEVIDQFVGALNSQPDLVEKFPPIKELLSKLTLVSS